VLLIGCALAACDGKETSHHATELSKHYLHYQYSLFSDDSSFYLQSIANARASLASARVPPSALSSQVRWGVVSHHLLIRDSIAEFFLRLSAIAHPTTIILLAPNHFSRGNHRIALSGLPWKTPFGLIRPANDIVKELTERGIGEIDEDAFYDEHSVRALVPYVKYFFPSTRIVPIIIRSDADTTEIDQMSRFLASKSTDDVLFLASLDFSHYQSSSIAQREDSTTYDILSRFDVVNYRSAFVDSHAVMRILLSTCKTLEATRIEIVLHTNSGIIMKDEHIPCTSYMNMFISTVHR
jgi:MEMO1 family protein